MARIRKTITLDEKIELAQMAVEKAKARYDAAVKELRDLLDKKDVQRKRELLKAVENIYGAPMPLVLEATFMPFRDVIISDGLVMPFNILVGGGMKRMFKDLYMTAKKSGRIHQSL